MELQLWHSPCTPSVCSRVLRLHRLHACAADHTSVLALLCERLSSQSPAPDGAWPIRARAAERRRHKACDKTQVVRIKTGQKKLLRRRGRCAGIARSGDCAEPGGSGRRGHADACCRGAYAPARRPNYARSQRPEHKTSRSPASAVAARTAAVSRCREAGRPPRACRRGPTKPLAHHLP